MAGNKIVTKSQKRRIIKNRIWRLFLQKYQFTTFQTVRHPPSKIPHSCKILLDTLSIPVLRIYTTWLQSEKYI